MKVSTCSLALALSLTGIAPAAAQNLPARDLTEEGELLAPPTGNATTLAPIPIASPSVGAGLGAAAVLSYNGSNGSDAKRPWSTGVTGSYTGIATDTDSWGFGAFQTMSFVRDRLRFEAMATYGEAHLDYFGIGGAAGRKGQSIRLHDKALSGMLDLQGKIFTHGIMRHLSVGARLFALEMDASAPPVPADAPSFTPPASQRHSTIAMIGPSFTFDSRDTPGNPHKGVLVEGSMLYGASWLGSDFTYHKLQFAANGYIPLSKSTVLGVRRQLCTASENTPYYDLCLLDLRGYEIGRYRDRASWALQLEARQKLDERVGAVAFFGVAGIAASGKDVWKNSTVLTSGGLGLRYLAWKAAGVNLSADLALGRDGPGLTLGIGEAF